MCWDKKEKTHPGKLLTPGFSHMYYRIKIAGRDDEVPGEVFSMQQQRTSAVSSLFGVAQVA